MRVQYKWLSMIMAFQVEAVAMVVFGWWVGKELNEKVPMGISWNIITFAIVTIIIMKTFIGIIKTIIKDSKREENNE